MQNLKFRFWDKDSKEWLNSSEMEFEYENTENPFVGIPFNLYQKNVEIQQFTGLKDSQNKEIFEGDIVKLVFGKIGEIKWYSESDNYDYSGWGSPAQIHGEGLSNSKIVGNIFENPELLNGRK